MKQIRVGVFETNSSSTHSLTVFTKEEYDLFQKGKLLIKDIYDSDTQSFLTFEEALELARKNEDFSEKEYNDCNDQEERIDYISLFLREQEIASVNTLDTNLDHEENTFTSKSGEEFVILCRYGHD